MIRRFIEYLFGCPHKRTTFPMRRQESISQLYVVCLACGKEFDYDWKAMRIGTTIEQVPLDLPVVTEERGA